MTEPLREGLPLREALLWLLQRRRRFAVRGPSMEPTLKDGDEVLVDPGAYRRAAASIGEIVLARHPIQSDLTVLKRVAAVAPDGSVELRGDNPRASTDSRSYGAVPASKLLGRVVLKLP